MRVTAPPEAGAKVRVEGVSKVFPHKAAPVQALDAVDLTIGEGEFVCMVGPSGCGKSTLLRIVADLMKPSTGRVEVSHVDPARPWRSVVFQDYGIFPWKTVAQNVRLGLRLNGVPKKKSAELAATWLDRVGLTDFADVLPDTLSGGMRQRVSVARAFALEPELLLMDEPFAALDIQLRTIMQDELVALWQTRRRSVLFITHNLDEAIYLGDRVVLMSSRPGRVVADFQVPFERPRDPRIRGSAEFAELEQRIWDLLRVEVEKALPGTMKTGAGDS
ncbi:nitrate ABC transporter ATP-binding protein [Acrocarpospora pleiomorpha]|uniref:Nitrate ABC transporter ATP-binding protein n=1 Tax=Acrocarpospora pleiomorpha TaxID=90975 RepID=A0A5M3X6L0_9ACTN|nr:ABC transporter ATP-binding protein [Acrocarpospora pleiomorpha]GES17325.1 nitrate ABC transporter ATP-binding protein [Acrocarpospora pleiomorpha]